MGRGMNIALIIAGGSGRRMGQEIPKQFLNVYDKPILIYTLEAFQCHPEISEIGVVCISGWEDMVRAYAKQFDIDKLAWVIQGGKTVQESIRDGVFYAEEKYSDDDILVIHDGIRPLVEESVLSDVIRVAEAHGAAVSSMPYNEQIFIVSEDDDTSTTEYVPRETLRRVVTPQAYRIKSIAAGYHRAFDEEIGIYGSSYANTMMTELGERLYFAAGSEKNIKLTTKEDIEIFKAYLNTEKSHWLK